MASPRPSGGSSAGAAANRLAALPIRARLLRGLGQGIVVTAAAMLAWWPTSALGLREGFWAAITAVAVASTRLANAQVVARNQVIGAILGGLVSAPISLLLPVGPIAFSVSLLACVTISYVLDKPTAARIAGMTAVIICLVPRTADLTITLASRLGEVAWGTMVGLALTSLWVRLHRAPTPLDESRTDDPGTDG